MGIGFLAAGLWSAGVAGQFDATVVIPEVGGEVGVGVALAIVAVEAVEPLLERAAGGVEEPHAPLAGDAGGLEDFRHGDGFDGKGFLAFGLDLPVAADRAVAGMESCHQGGAARGANGGATVGLGETGAFPGHPVEPGGWMIFWP